MNTRSSTGCLMNGAEHDGFTEEESEHLDRLPSVWIHLWETILPPGPVEEEPDPFSLNECPW